MERLCSNAPPYTPRLSTAYPHRSLTYPQPTHKLLTRYSTLYLYPLQRGHYAHVYTHTLILPQPLDCAHIHTYTI